jgi:uncharacterized protein (DUF433 family)
MTAANPLIEETPRGPSVAGTRITVYSIRDYIKNNRSKEYILRRMPLITAEQLEAVYEYIAQHREAVEAEYEQILRRSAERQEEARKVWLARAPYPPDLPEEERLKLMRQRIAEIRAAAQANIQTNNGSNATA